MELALSGGEVIQATPGQRFATASGQLLAAASLQPGTQLRTHDGPPVAVTSITDRPGSMEVHCLTLKSGETYFVGAAGVEAHFSKR